MKGTLIIMAKAPLAGRVKTRLGADLGVARATALYRFMLKATIEEAVAGEWNTLVAIAPRSAMSHRIFARREMTLVAQSSGGLGDRLLAAIKAAPPGPVALIGGDAPQMRTESIREAFQRLQRDDAVFGPADDGGFWLMGLAQRQRAPQLFHRVRWSSSHTLADTIKSLPTHFRMSKIKMLTDIDQEKDLGEVGARAFLRSVRQP